MVGWIGLLMRRAHLSQAECQMDLSGINAESISADLIMLRSNVLSLTTGSGKSMKLRKG